MDGSIPESRGLVSTRHLEVSGKLLKFPVRKFSHLFLKQDELFDFFFDVPKISSVAELSLKKVLRSSKQLRWSWKVRSLDRFILGWCTPKKMVCVKKRISF